LTLGIRSIQECIDRKEPIFTLAFPHPKSIIVYYNRYARGYLKIAGQLSLKMRALISDIRPEAGPFADILSGLHPGF
jgi:hypothetical protein